MRVLQLVQRPQRRGAEIFAQQLTEALAREGHATRTVYLYPYNGELPLEVKDGDVLLDADEHAWTERFPGIDPRLLRRLIPEIERFQPDIVQVNGARTVKYGSFAKRFRSAGKWRLVYRNIDDPAYWLRDRRRRWFYRNLVMPQVDGTVGVSRATLESVVKMYGIRSPAIAIPNGIDAARLDCAPVAQTARDRLQLKPAVACLLFVGSLTRQKRPDRFLHLVSRLQQEHLEVEGWVIGDGPEREHLHVLAKNLGVASTTHFVGYVTDVATYMRAADVLVVTSDSDGIPAVVLEAAYLGTPTVATHVGGLGECVLDRQSGILVPPGDEQALVDAVATLLRDPALREQMGRCAQAWVGERFTIDKVAAQYADFYSSVRSKHGR